ncbi:MAG: signal peptidase I [Butyrivibrio sp.]|nr:signal peptidase I [Butyrivibrio sp.]
MLIEKFINKILQKSQVLITVLAFLSMIIFISCLATGVATGRPSFFGYRIMWVRTPSMEPAIMTGDFVLVKTADESDVSVGDIAVYRKKDADVGLFHYRIIHRIIAKTGDGNFIFKGDNNEAPDPYEVAPDQMEYKTVYVF